MKVYYNEIDPYAAQWIRNLMAGGHIPGETIEQAGSDGIVVFWDAYDLIPCADGKTRRVEPGVAALVARLSDSMVPSGDPSPSYAQATAEGRVMRLKGYGNAINPILAAEFIKAVMDELDQHGDEHDRLG